MDIGICVASHIGDTDYIVEAERLGYSAAWLADSQMIWSDCYATLAFAASKTERIRLGTGVAVAGTRPPAVNAAGIATINAIAPGRTFFGVGAGNTALRIMGQPPMPIAAFDRYLGEIRPLLRGEESSVRIRNRQVPIRHIMPDSGFVNFEHEIPMYVSGFGPKSLGLAGKHGDGAVIGSAGAPAVIENAWKAIEAGASAAGRTIHRNDFYMTALTTISILDPGEDAGSERIKRECGAIAISGLHYAYDQVRQMHFPPPAHAADIWPEYTAMLDAVEPERLHQRIHAGHCCWVIPEEERFVTKTLIERSCIVGTKDEVVDRLRALQAAGLDQVMILPSLETRYDVLERVAKEIIPSV